MNSLVTNLDHYSVEYTFADRTNLFMNARNISGCDGEFASHAHGSKGSAVISTNMHTPAKCRIYKEHNLIKGDLAWAFPQPEPNPYQLEWDHLIDAIRQDGPFNEARGAPRQALCRSWAACPVRPARSLPGRRRSIMTMSSRLDSTP